MRQIENSYSERIYLSWVPSVGYGVYNRVRRGRGLNFPFLESTMYQAMRGYETN